MPGDMFLTNFSQHHRISAALKLQETFRKPCILCMFDEYQRCTFFYLNCKTALSLKYVLIIIWSVFSSKFYIISDT